MSLRHAGWSSALALLLTICFAGTAWGGSEHYRVADWPNDAPLYVDSSMAAPFNSATAQSEMAIARGPWNSIFDASFHINYLGTTAMASGITVNGVPNGRIYMTDSVLSGNVTGLTTTVFTATDITKALIEIDTDLAVGTWHINPSASLGNQKLDMRAVATHEIGHAIGFNSGHINISCGNWLNAQTMCASHIVSPASGGPFPMYYRSLEAHEKADHAASY